MNIKKYNKKNILSEISEKIKKFTDQQLLRKINRIEYNLMGFANFMEAKFVLLYTKQSDEIPTENIIKKCFKLKKNVIIPIISESKHLINLFKINDYDTDLVKNNYNILQPNTETCKEIELDQIDIAVIPGLGFDEKGGRLGFGEGFYSRLITRLPETTRKISIAFEEQMVRQIQMESRKYNVDIVITDKRIIYKI
ncbi:MAG: 5-formyltetrahydrofolate cyclo-ligase [Desulfobacteraceae bacterium 4572_130]|nr:MAG: 5-formyltetrahydrofolate cyclo-ligase [Desulfobacteraceae bacterium 4572_130]